MQSIKIEGQTNCTSFYLCSTWAECIAKRGAQLADFLSKAEYSRGNRKNKCNNREDYQEEGTYVGGSLIDLLRVELCCIKPKNSSSFTVGQLFNNYCVPFLIKKIRKSALLTFINQIKKKSGNL